MRRWAATLGLLFLLALGFLVGCMGPVVPPDEPVTPAKPIDYSLTGTANYVPADADRDPYPMFVGARWIYRNAGEDWNTNIAAAGLLESEVVAEAQDGDIRCYVLLTRYSNGPDEYIYVHRTGSAVQYLASVSTAAPGAQPTFSLSPGLTYLDLPFVPGDTWTLQFKQGTVTGEVLHPEVVAIQAGLSSLLGPYKNVFTNVARVHFDIFGSVPRLFGGTVQFLWFAEGVGVVKHVLNSANYELVEFRKRSEVASLTERRTQGDVPLGGVVTMQLRGGSPSGSSGAIWSLEGVSGPQGTVEELKHGFYPDLGSAIDAGTYTYAYRATARGTAVLTFIRTNLETGRVEDKVEFTVRVQ